MLCIQQVSEIELKEMQASPQHKKRKTENEESEDDKDSYLCNRCELFITQEPCVM